MLAIKGVGVLWIKAQPVWWVCQNVWAETCGARLVDFSSNMETCAQIKKNAMEYELFCVRICKGCAIRAMLLTAKGFQKVLNQFPFLLPQSCRIFTIVLRCIEKFKVHIMNLWTSSCPGPNTVFFWGCLFAAYRMFSIAVIHSFWPKLVLQMAGRPHPHVMLTYPTPEPYPKWFPCPINPINPIILRHEPTEFRKSTRSRAGCHGELRKYPCFIHV